MKKLIVAVLVACILSACAGIPLRSLPRLMKLQDRLLEANPAEFSLAVQVDQRMVPPADAVPQLVLVVRPSEPGAFESIEKKLPMRFTIATTNALGLSAPAGERRWLIYTLPPESQAELVGVQNHFKRIRTQARGVVLGVGIAQDGIASRDPALARTRWESWLQTSRQEGFFEIWSGSIADLLERAKSQSH